MCFQNVLSQTSNSAFLIFPINLGLVTLRQWHLLRGIHLYKGIETTAQFSQFGFREWYFFNKTGIPKIFRRNNVIVLNLQTSLPQIEINNLENKFKIVSL